MAQGRNRARSWTRRISSTPHWIELLLILLLTAAFCGDILDLSPQQILPGNESDIVQSLDWTLMNSLRGYGKFPLWNPYLKTGMPYVADPFLHTFNPLSTIPVLLLGVQAGFKIALFLSFLAAGVGMWWLGRVLGLRAPTRVWMALMYAFTGQAVARFFQGEYDFVLGYAWIPWVFAALIAAVDSKQKRYAAIGVFSLGMLFFSGNVYYSYYMLFAIATFSLTKCVRIHLAERSVAIDQENVKMIGLIGVLALGLIAVQLLPMAEFWPYTSKFNTSDLRDSHSIRQIFLDYLSKDPRRPDAIETLPSEEFYAYTGIWPFLALGLFPFARRRGRRHVLLFFSLLLLFAIAWIDIRDMPWRGIYLWLNSLIQFRYPTRMLIYGAVSILVLAAFGIDGAWRGIRDALSSASGAGGDGARRGAALIAVGAMLIFMVISVGDVFRTNQERVYTRDRYEIAYEMMDWLSEYDQSEYYVSNWLNWHAATISNRLRYIDGWYGFYFHPPKDHAMNDRPVVARPKYVILGNDRTPEEPTAIVAKAFETHTIYQLPESLPFAFAVPDERLMGVSTDEELKLADVTPVSLILDEPNRMRIKAQGDSDATLVTMVAYYPGWRLSVDGQEQQLRNVGGYLAADLRPGEHIYEFAFRPASFFTGLGISAVALALTLGMLARDLDLQKSIMRRWRIPRLGLPPLRLPSGQRAGSTQFTSSGRARTPPGRTSPIEGVLSGEPGRALQLERGDRARVVVRVDHETDVILTVSVEASENSPD